MESRGTVINGVHLTPELEGYWWKSEKRQCKTEGKETNDLPSFAPVCSM